jgi:hypothetical protein
MTYSPLNINVYTAAYAGAVAGCGIPTGAFITDPTSDDYGSNISVAVAFAQAVDTAWGANAANTYDIEAITDASDNLFARGPGCPIGGVIITQANWTIVATALVALIKKGDSVASAGGITFPSGNGVIPSFTITQELWVAASWGSDITGDGSIFNPFKTIAHARSVITDASATKIYEIILYPGTYAEDIPLKAFTKIVGFDPTQSRFNYTYPANLTGIITLGPSFAFGLPLIPIAWITNAQIYGTFSLDFVTDGSTNGSVSVTNCQYLTDCTVNMGSNNYFELHGCTVTGNYTQTGGVGLWENIAADNSGGTLDVKAAATSGARLNMYNSCWQGNIHADQNGNNTGGEVVTINMINSEARNATCTITATSNNLPTINAPYGNLPENPTLSGTGAALSRQMRVSAELHVPSGTEIGVNGTTDVTIDLPTGLIGSTSIENMSCTIISQGAFWGTDVVAHNCSWSFYTVQNGATPEVHVVFLNPVDNDVTTSHNLSLLFYAFQPNITA